MRSRRASHGSARPLNCGVSRHMKCLHVTVALLLFGVGGPANADWVSLGAAINCDPANGLFELASVVETSTPTSDIPAPEGFKVLPLGQKQFYECRLGAASIGLTINVYGPKERGMGQGAGVIRIDSLRVSDELLIDHPTNFNWQVSGERVLTRIRIVAGNTSTLKVNLCMSDGWSWDFPFNHEKCAARLPDDG